LPWAFDVAAHIRFLTVDGFNLIRRIFEARRPIGFEDLVDVVDATKGSLKRAIDRFLPSHAAVVLEDHDRTWRHLLYRDYKANRSPTPNLLLSHLDLFAQAFSELGVTSCTVQNYEADDIIGTLATVVAKHGGEVLILSTDKIYLQLISDNIKVVDHFQDRTWLEADVKRKYGVRVDQYIDYLALVGDRSNNIKGVPGIGPKLAEELLSVHGDLQCVLTASGSDKLVFKVQAAHEDARRCRQLVTLKTDVDLGRNLKSFRLQA